jgi:hypothetical protein
MKAIFFAVLMVAIGNEVSASAAEKEIAGAVIIEPSDADSPLVVDKAKDEADLRKMKEIDRILRATEIPKVEFRDATLDETLLFLNQKTGLRFVNALLPLDPLDTPKASLSLKNIASQEVLFYMVQLHHVAYEVTPEAILFVPKTTECGVMEAIEYRVSFETITRLVQKAGFSADGLADADLLKPSLRQCLEKLGISFPPGGSATYLRSSERLIVRASENAHELLESILDEVKRDQKDETIPLEERRVERQFRRVLEANHQLSQQRLERVHARGATMQEIIDEIIEKLHKRLVFVQAEGITLQPRLPGQSFDRVPSPTGPRLNLSLENVTLVEFLQELARQTGTELIVGSRTFVLLAPSPAAFPAKVR